ncbi:MAG: ABC transporter permease [Phycisphaerae bacterium]
MTPARPAAVRVPRRLATRAAAGTLLLVGLACFVLAPAAARRSNVQRLDQARRPPGAAAPFGTDALGRSLLWRCLLGGATSLAIAVAAAALSVALGVGWGSLAALAGGRTDALLMRVVDVLYGLPYLLLVILLKIGLSGAFERMRLAPAWADWLVVLLAIGGVSWLTMARVVRAAVRTLAVQPFVDAARAVGLGPLAIWWRHLLPNLVGVVTAYATLTVPQAILQESFLSFLGIGIQPPQPSWGNLAGEGLTAINGVDSAWWLLAFPCGLLSITLLALNVLGDAVRDALDPHRSRA